MNNSSNYKTVYFHLALACFSAAALNAFLLVIFRIGLDTHFEIALGSLAMLGGILCTPFILWRFINCANNSSKNILLYICTLTLLMALPLLGYIGLANTVLPLFIIVSGFGLYCAFKTSEKTPEKIAATIKTLWPCVLAGALFGLYVFLKSHMRFYSGVFAPEHAVLGTLNRDTYFHPALANMIYEYDSFSMGAGSLNAIKYHFTLHIWMAPFQDILNKHLIEILPFLTRIMLYPLLLLSIGTAVFTHSAAKCRDVPKLICTLILLLFVTEAIGWQSQWASESYALSLIFLFFALSLTPIFAPLNRSAIVAKDASFNYALLLFSILILIALTAKISVGLIAIGFAGYLCLRYHGLRYPVWLLGLVVLLCMYLVIAHMQAGHGENLELFAFLKERGFNVNFAPYIPLLFLTFGHLRLIKNRASTTYHVPRKYWEALCVVGTICFIVPNTVYIIGGSGFYFIDIVRWIGIWLFLWWACANDIPAQLSNIKFVNQVLNFTPWRFVNALIPYALVAAVIASFTPYVTYLMYKHYIQPASNAAEREYNDLAIDPTRLGENLKGGILGKHMHAVLQDGFTQRLSNAVAEQDSIKDGKSAIYIPYDHPYWSWPEICARGQGLYLQALFSVPILNSYPYIKSERCIYSAFRVFGQTKMDKPEAESKSFLCGLADGTDFNDIYVLSGTLAQPAFEKTSCSLGADN